MIVSTVLAVTMTLAPQQSQAPNHQFVHADPNRASRTMDRFNDNDRRWVVETLRREQVQAYRETVISRRAQLADQLDRMIASGHCEGARGVAQRAGYRDIQDGVAKLCDARQGG